MQHSLDIALVIPAVENTYGLIQEAHAPEFHLGVGYIASYLSTHGFSVDVTDMAVTGQTLSEAIDRLVSLQPCVVGFTIVTPYYNLVKRMVTLLKPRLPATTFICGGSHATALPKLCLTDAGFDLVAVGEGEWTTRQILSAVKESGDFSHIPGIAYLKDGNVLKTGPTARMDLDDLPFPYRDSVTVYNYKNQIYFDDPDAACYNLLTTRGCPYRCTFCGAATVFPGKTRRRSAVNVFAEIRHACEIFQVRYLFFEDSTFVYDMDFVKELCQKIIDAKLFVQWGAMGRLNHVDLDMYKIMKQAGCRFLFYGVESADNEILKKIRKNFTIEQAFHAVAQIKTTGIASNCSFILGLPGETPETLEKSIQTALRMDPDYISFSLATPYPGTELWEQCLADGWTPPSWEAYELSRYTKPMYVPSGLTEDALLRALKEAYKRFYFRIPYMLRHVSKIHRFSTLKKHFWAACSLLTDKS